MFAIWFPRLLLCFAVPFAARKGGEPERLVAVVLLADYLLDCVNHAFFGDPTWFEVNPGHFVIDLWVLLTLTWVALYANRGWTLWVSATQLIVVVAHFAKLSEMEVARRSYWAITQVPFMLQGVVLMVGTWAHVQRQRRFGRYRAWRVEGPAHLPAPGPAPSGNRLHDLLGLSRPGTGPGPQR